MVRFHFSSDGGDKVLDVPAVGEGGSVYCGERELFLKSLSTGSGPWRGGGGCGLGSRNRMGVD